MSHKSSCSSRFSLPGQSVLSGCSDPQHNLSRRALLAGLTAGSTGALGLGAFAHPAVAGELEGKKRQLLVVFLAGGVSQLESWDPKPGAATGGPFRAIPTSVPGIHICELLPHTAKQMHHLTLIRGINTKENNHAQGAYFMSTGRRQSPAQTYPHLGAAAAQQLTGGLSELPGYVHITPGSRGYSRKDAAFLGPQFAPIVVDDKPPQNLTRPKGLATERDRARNQLREQFNTQFAHRRRKAETEAYNASFDSAAQLMEQTDLFDVTQESPKDQDRYGKHDFGRHCLLARRLLETGVTCVRVTHRNYDTHFENFNFHIEQLNEFDRPFATLLGDLAASGMLQHTLVVVMSEFGRTPKINSRLGRDHWGTSWSIALGGCGVAPGGVYGKTSPDGTKVVEGQCDAADLFHTYLCALGLDSSSEYVLGGRKIPVADPAHNPIREVLA